MSLGANAGPLSVSESVRDVQTDDGAVLLDLHQGICFSMTPVAIKIWHCLKEGASMEQITERLCTDYPDIGADEVKADVEDFLRDLKAKKMLFGEEAKPRDISSKRLARLLQPRSAQRASNSQLKRKLRRFLFWKALFGLMAFDLLGFNHNFCRSYSFVRRWDVALARTIGDAPEQVCRAVNMACVWYPKRVLCLQRSVITTCLLRHCGVPAQMVMGAQKFPFKAHSWTEVDGRPVNERRDVRNFYLVWERC